MTRVLRPFLTFGVVAAVLSAAPAWAQKAAKKEARAAQRASEKAFEFPAEITLSPEQQAKVKALKDEYGPKLQAANKKLTDILTPEQRAARAEAGKANREAKKTGKQARDAQLAALKLTDEQKVKWDAAQKESQELRKLISQKMHDLLTEDQKAKLPKRGKPKKAK
jgi:hypothetical protein